MHTYFFKSLILMQQSSKLFKVCFRGPHIPYISVHQCDWSASTDPLIDLPARAVIESRSLQITRSLLMKWKERSRMFFHTCWPFELCVDKMSVRPHKVAHLIHTETSDPLGEYVLHCACERFQCATWCLNEKNEVSSICVRASIQKIHPNKRVCVF